MITQRIRVVEVDDARYLGEVAHAPDCPVLVDKSTRIEDHDTGAPIAAYVRLDDIGVDLTWLAPYLKRLRFRIKERTRGLRTESRFFGMYPRQTIRKDFCSAAHLSRQNPEVHSALLTAMNKASRLYRAENPSGYLEHLTESREYILPEWRPDELSPFTSGIVNKNNVLPYHYDRGNVEGRWSAMFVLRNGTDGGELCLPQWGVRIACADNSLLLFDGQRALHGVTPLQRATPDSYRYSVVFYTMRAMWDCLDSKAELERIKRLKTEREHKRARERRQGA